MNISRRFFIAGAASFGAFGGSRLLRAAPGAASGKPNLTFGVVSDIHFSAYVGTPAYAKNSETFRHTLEWFRDQGVDAVMVVGDMADNGMVEQLQGVADAWYAVFPNDMAPIIARSRSSSSTATTTGRAGPTAPTPKRSSPTPPSAPSTSSPPTTPGGGNASSMRPMRPFTAR